MEFLKEFLKKLRIFDYIVILIVIIAVLVGILTVSGVRKTSSERIVGESQIAMEVFLKGVTVTSQNSPFKAGEETFITIRNVPHTKLKITDVKLDRRKIMLPSSKNREGFIVTDDVSQPFQYDFLVTVTDKAKITKDGAVVGGNKVKTGLPVTLEGFDYRINGIISNIVLLNKESPANATK